jgi:hypothetical protein
LLGEFAWHTHHDTDETFIVEPRGVVNTGDAGGSLTSENDVWV